MKRDIPGLADIADNYWKFYPGQPKGIFHHTSGSASIDSTNTLEDLTHRPHLYWEYIEDEWIDVGL